jgi:hypothetical protein
MTSTNDDGYIGENYLYHSKIKSPLKLGLNTESSISKNIGGMLSYVEVLVTGNSDATNYSQSEANNTNGIIDIRVTSFTMVNQIASAVQNLGCSRVRTSYVGFYTQREKSFTQIYAKGDGVVQECKVIATSVSFPENRDEYLINLCRIADDK